MIILDIVKNIVLESKSCFVIVVNFIKGYLIFLLRVWIWKLKVVIKKYINGIFLKYFFIDLIIRSLVIW